MIGKQIKIKTEVTSVSKKDFLFEVLLLFFLYSMYEPLPFCNCISSHFKKSTLAIQQGIISIRRHAKVNGILIANIFTKI